MNKDIKKSIDSIQVPFQKLDAAIEEGLRASQKKVAPKKVMMLLLSSAAAFGLIIGSGFISPTMASVLAKVPILYSIFTSVGDKGLQVAINDKNAMSLNETLTSNGVSLTIQDVLYDGSRLAFSFVQDKAEEIYPLHIEVNGEVINFSENMTGEYLPNGQYSGLIQVHPTKPLPNEFDLSVAIHQIGKTEGDWHFETHVKKTNNNSINLTTGQKTELDGLSYEVKKFESTNSAVSLHILYKGTVEEIMNEHQVLQLHLLDQDGTVIPMINSSGSGDAESMLLEYVFEPISEKVTDLTISPFFMPLVIERKEITATLEENQLPLTISQGEMGDIVVTKVEEENGKYALYFESTSSFPFGSNFEMNQLSVEDTDGNDLIADGGYPKAIGKNKYKLYFNDTKGNGDIILKTFVLPHMTLNQQAQITVKVPR
ncbi:hypothetical protein HMPREF1210_01032 [Paenisporosarcina sp. HGH0030]|uniref:DUF4179 domain-containing protein n=1 Tax=Paenisporosarcina sp. HGH0030 TaxID=1078085 RepID=UPI00034E1929|nr:DUF4179 domain-containing protein [Paenisporosarcina sp. HGH0030]EPD53301.1 hypothetical protein HMPREF1210_01032 [Paenisporosarcina sp. HGH0030]